MSGRTFLAVIGGLLMMRLPQAVARRPASGLAHMRKGVRFLTRSQDVLVLMSIVGEALGPPAPVGLGAVVSLIFGLAVAVRYRRVRDTV